MKAHELQEKALRLLEMAKTTMNPSHRKGLMDEAFELVKQAKRLREQSPQTRRGRDRPVSALRRRKGGKSVDRASDQ